MLLSTIITALTCASAIRATYTCYTTSASDSYPYCISIPDVMPSDNCGGGLPFVLYLPGAGAKGVGNDIYTHTTWDGFGMLLKRYRDGDRSTVAKLAAERFVTVIPMPPWTEPGSNPAVSVYHFWPQNLDKVLQSVRSTYGSRIDWKRMHCVGYSMGARGCWRFGTAYASLLATSTSIGGAAERSGDINLIREPTYPTFPSLGSMAHLQLRQYAGTWDEVATISAAQGTQNELVRLGARSSALRVVDENHQTLQTIPFDVDLLSWLLTYKQPYDANAPRRPVSTNTPISGDKTAGTCPSVVTVTVTVTATPTAAAGKVRVPIRVFVGLRIDAGTASRRDDITSGLVIRGESSTSRGLCRATGRGMTMLYQSR